MDMNSKPVARRVFGAGIVCTGLLILSVGLIIGLQFPGFVYHRNLVDVCIEDTIQPRYHIWANEEYLDKYNRLYYWEITNKEDFLYHRKTPQVQQRGPYVYRETLKKVGVRFFSRVVRFHEWRRQRFDSSRTHSECGKLCTQNDEITVLNTRYLQEISSYNGTLNYGLSRIPEIMALTLRKVTHLLHGYIDTETLADTLAEFGRINDSKVESFRQQLRYPEGFSGLPFPVWLAAQPLDYSSVILDNRPQGDFTSKEMAGLYDALTNPLLLGTLKEILTGDTVREECSQEVQAFKSLDSYGHTNQLFSQTLHITDVKFSDLAPDETPCGLLTYLRLCHEHKKAFINKSTQTSQNISNIISQYLCRNVTYSCLELPDNHTIRTAYISAIYDYIFSHLLLYTDKHVSEIFSGDLVRTFRQQELALGWWEGGITSEGMYAQNFTWVPGLLENYPNETEAERCAKEVALRTCNDSPGAKTNMMWHAYNGQASVPEAWFPNVSTSKRSIHAIRHHLPPPMNLKACKSHDLPQHRHVIFDPDFHRQMTFVRKEFNTLGGARVVRLVFNTSDIAMSSGWVTGPGLQDMSQAWGYPGWMSLPHFQEAGEYLQTLFHTSPNTHQHIPFVDVQPITGEVYKNAMRFQHNAAITLEVQGPRSRSYDIGYINQPIPVYWMEKLFLFNSKGIKDFKSRLGELLNTSCGGLVGLSFVASIIILGGLLSAVFTIKDGRIMPVNDDQGHTQELP